MSYYAHYDENSNELMGFYNDEIHSTIPEPAVQITEEQWENALNTLNSSGGTKKCYIQKEADQGILFFVDVPEPLIVNSNINLQDRYISRLNTIQNAFVKANLSGNWTAMTSAQGDYGAVLAEFRILLKEFKDGVSESAITNPYVENVYCPVCGNIFDTEECSNCGFQNSYEEHDEEQEQEPNEENNEEQEQEEEN